MPFRPFRQRTESNSGLPASLTSSLSVSRLARARRVVSGAGDGPQSRPVVIFVLAIFLALAFNTVSAVSSPIQPAAAAEISDEAHFVVLINELREERGLQPLTIHPELTRESRVWATQLRANDELSHAGDLSTGITTVWLKLGENVGVGPVDRIDDLFDAFIASPDHLANLIDPRFEAVGVGVIYDDQGRLWTTHRFMDIDNANDDGVSSEPQLAGAPDGTDSLAPGTVDPDAVAPDELAATGSDPASDAIAGATKEPPRSAPLPPSQSRTTIELDERNASELFALLDG